MGKNEKEHRKKVAIRNQKLKAEQNSFQKLFTESMKAQIEEMKKNTPDYFVLFAWNHEHEILEKEIELTKNGVKWIRFVPQVELIPNHE